MRLLIAFLMSAWLATGCGKNSDGTVLGVTPKNSPREIQSVRNTNTTAVVTVAGTMIEKCPVAGCWFRLRDKTGVIKVDTKSAGFVVVDVPLQTVLTVEGKIQSDGNGDFQIEATGLRY